MNRDLQARSALATPFETRQRIGTAHACARRLCREGAFPSGRKAKFSQLVRWYRDLMAKPPRDVEPGLLNTVRLHAAAAVTRAYIEDATDATCLRIASALADIQLTAAPGTECHDRLGLERIAVDELHSLRREGRRG